MHSDRRAGDPRRREPRRAGYTCAFDFDNSGEQHAAVTARRWRAAPIEYQCE
jgi:hypothetical protein